MRFDLRLLAGLPLLLLSLGANCGTGSDDDDTPEPEPCQRPENRSAPEFVGVQGPDGDQTAGFAVQILAQVDDPDGIAVATLFYRIRGTDLFLTASMSQVDEENAIWAGSVPGNYVVAPGVEFYVSARDAGPCADVSLSPEGAPADGLYGFDTVVVASSIPLNEDFEVPSCTVDEDLGGGWTAVMQKFPDPGHAWLNSQSLPYSGACSIRHSDGVPSLWECPPPEDVGTQERVNWLISPALDLTTKDEVFLRFFERHRVSGPCAEKHSVYVSVGSPDPGPLDQGVGDYELVVDELPFPGLEWQASQWIDLSAYAGNDAVYVGIVYQGGAAGVWQIDDVYIGAPQADLALDSVPVLDPTVEPGATGLTLDLVIANVGTEYDAPPLSATLETADGDLVITQAAASYPAIPVGGTGAADAQFVFDIDVDHPDNAWLDFTLRLDDGAGHEWALPVRLLLGEESFATVSFPAGAAPPTLTMGHGPVAQPNFQETVTTASLADSDGDGSPGPWTLNVTGQAAKLPPGPGPRRWFLIADNTSGTSDAAIAGWEFLVGGAISGPSELPVTVLAGQSVTLRYPAPPQIAVTAVSTTPDPAAPGGAVTLDSLEITNNGASTVGPLVCVLDSADPLVSGISSGQLTFGSAPIANGDLVLLDQTPSFDVGAAATQNEPVSLILLCSDGYDSLPVPFTVDVPYGRPVVDSVLVDDSSSACGPCNGDNDGYADPSETVAVTLVARNDGGLALTAPLTATVSASPSSPVSFTLTNGNNLGFGSALLAPGETATATGVFQLGVSPTALLGDRMVIDVLWQSGSDSWTDELTIDVTGIPWLPCNAAEDAMGDSLAANGLDIRSCDYRSDNATLQVRVNSWNEFDPTVQALWFLFYEAPSLYSVEFVPPAFADLETGCLSGDSVTPLSIPLSVDNGLTDSASLRVGLSDMSVLGRNIQVAFAVGFCAGFCDVYPSSAAVWPSGGNPSCTQSQYIPISW